MLPGPAASSVQIDTGGPRDSPGEQTGVSCRQLVTSPKSHSWFKANVVAKQFPVLPESGTSWGLLQYGGCWATTNDSAFSMSRNKSSSLFPLPVTAPSYEEQTAEGSPVQYHCPGRRNRFRAGKQPAKGHTVGRWHCSLCLLEEDGEEKHAFLLQDALGDGRKATCPSAAVSGLGPHPGCWHHGHHNTLGNVTVSIRVTLPDFLKLKKEMHGNPQGQRRA